MKRRNFLISSALGVPVVASATTAGSAKSKIQWDKETDIVVIGCGAAGASAAIEAKDRGAEVLILEKAPFAGGNTLVSGGGITIPKDPAKAMAFFSKTFEFANNEYDPELLKVFVAEIGKQKDWLPNLWKGMEPYMYRGARFKMLPGADTIEKFMFRGNGHTVDGGPALWAIFENGLKAKQIPVLYETPAIHIIKDGDVVVGVEALKNNQPYFVKARKAVVLTTGGYENSPLLLGNLAQGKDILNFGTPYNTGDGLNMAEEVGAAFWHTSAYSCPLGVKIPGKTAAMSAGIPASGLWVDQNGRRFANEKGIDLHAALYIVNLYDSSELKYPRIPAFLIFDKKAFDKGEFGFRVKEGAKSVASFGWIGLKEGFHWSGDGKWELENKVIRRYSNLKELAKAERINLDNLQETLKIWNKDVSQGKDSQYGREVRRGSRAISLPLEGDEVYVMTLYPALLNTQGGPKHNVKSQVLDVRGNPIPRLYVAGELGSMWGTIYEGGCNLGECIVFGRIAGKVASMETSIS